MHVTCLSPSNSFDYPAVFEELLVDAVDEELVLDGFYPHRGSMPDDKVTDAILLSGSEFHVYDRPGWMAEMKDYVQEALLEDIPVLGVCFGNQLLADLLGGTVQPMPEREMGYRTINLTDEGNRSRMFVGVGSSFTCFQSHQDTVAVPPAEAEILAENEYGVQALSFEILPAWGIQFHPEYSREMAMQLIEEKELSDERRRDLMDSVTDRNVEAAHAARQVFSNFFKIV